MKYVYYVVYKAKNANNDLIEGSVESSCDFQVKSINDIINMRKSIEKDLDLHSALIVNFILINTIKL